MKRTLAATALVVIFTLALAAPVFGSDMEYSGRLEFDGTIDFTMQAGHWCNTGAEMQQRITGTGSMSKALDIFMEKGVIQVEDNMDWVTAPNAIRNLTVTTAIKLCAPPKYTYDDDDGDVFGTTAPNRYNPSYTGPIYQNGTLNRTALEADYANALTDQIWAVMVSPNPGYSGNIEMKFEAANSNKVFGTAWTDAATQAAFGVDWDDIKHDASWLGAQSYPDTWPGVRGRTQGPWFPGSYFNITQMSRTSNGTHRRYIDISSPWNHGYLSETMTVVGNSYVWEEFSMSNLTAGDEVGRIWWDLF